MQLLNSPFRVGGKWKIAIIERESLHIFFI